MSKVIIYTKKGCHYCEQAKSLLGSKNINYMEIDATDNDELISEMIRLSNGKKTFPQIFISIGGFDQINDLDKKGELDKILNEH